MNTLHVPLAALAETPAIVVDVTTDEASIRPVDVEPAGIGTVRLSGVLSKIDTELYFEGEAAAELAGVCDRCLGPMRLQLRQPAEWYFESGRADFREELAHDDIALEIGHGELEDIDGRVVRMYTGEFLDLGPCVWEELILAVPSKRLCREDCKGMCPQCGANLNDGQCGCAGKAKAAAIHPGLGKLKDLYPDLPDRAEE